MEDVVRPSAAGVFSFDKCMTDVALPFRYWRHVPTRVALRSVSGRGRRQILQHSFGSRCGVAAAVHGAHNRESTGFCHNPRSNIPVG